MSCGKCSDILQWKASLPSNYDGGLFNCDICSKPCNASEGVFHCPKCMWDACLNCICLEEEAAQPKERGLLRHEKIDWAALQQALPTQLNATEKARRMDMFKQFDPNSNNILSLAEIDKGVRDVLRMPLMFRSKPVMMRAFQAAKSVSKSAHQNPDFIEKSEFRLLLVYLHQYFELKVLFDNVDVSDDNRVNLEEFTNALPLLAKWGVNITDPKAAFDQIDKNKGGMLLFDEFAKWAITKHIAHSESSHEE